MPAALPPLFLNYHAINDPRHPEWGHPDPVNSLTKEAFLRQLGILEHEGASIVPMRDVLEGKATNRRPVVLSFDDGHVADQRITWPLLQEKGIRGAFFICLLNIGGAQDPRWGELRRMHEEGHVIGAHGVDHTPFTKLSAAKQRTEMLRSKEVIEQRIGTTVDLFAFPSGKITRYALKEAPALGFTALFSTLGPYAPSREHPSLIHRWSLKTGTSDARFRNVVRGGSLTRFRSTAEAPLRKWWSGYPLTT